MPITHIKRPNQAGATLVSVALGLLALIIVGTMLAQVARIAQYEQVANVTFDRVEGIHNAMQRAYMDAITTGTSPNAINAYPSSYDELLAGGYIDDCTEADEIASKCINAIKVPWVDKNNLDERIEIRTFVDSSDNYPVFELSFSIDSLQPIKQRNIVKSRLVELPNFRDNGAGEIRIIFKRPASTVMYENLVSRDGEKAMTNSWDFGGHDLNNVRDIAFSGLSDRTALTGSIKFGSGTISDSSGLTVPKHDCPVGYEAKLQSWTVGVGGDGDDEIPYNTRGFNAWPVDNGDHWTVHLRVLGENKTGDPTYFYTGAVTYATWCDF